MLAAEPDLILGQMSAMDSPLLLVQGLRDDHDAQHQMSVLAERVQGPMKWVILRHDGHFPQHESTEVVLDLICGHLEEPERGLQRAKMASRGNG